MIQVLDVCAPSEEIALHFEHSEFIFDIQFANMYDGDDFVPYRIASNVLFLMNKEGEIGEIECIASSEVRSKKLNRPKTVLYGFPRIAVIQQNTEPGWIENRGDGRILWLEKRRKYDTVALEGDIMFFIARNRLVGIGTGVNLV